jgi:hypothetical protein
MRSSRRPLEYRDKLIWVQARLTSSWGHPVLQRLVLDTATSNTSLSVELAERLGFPESRKVGDAWYDSPQGPVHGYTVRLPAIGVMGREIQDYLVGCQVFYSRLHVPGILGLDFFLGTDILLSLRKKMGIHLAW